MIKKMRMFLIFDWMVSTSWVSEKNNKGANVVIARILLLDNVVGILQYGYKDDHSISESAESIGIIHIM